VKPTQLVTDHMIDNIKNNLLNSVLDEYLARHDYEGNTLNVMSLLDVPWKTCLSHDTHIPIRKLTLSKET